MSKILGIDSGTFDIESLTEQCNQKGRDWLCVYYNPSASGRLEIVSLKTAFTLISGIQVLSTAYVNAVDAVTLGEQYATNPDQVVIPNEIYESEINNPESNGYVASNEKREILSRMRKVSSSGTTDSAARYVDTENDYIPIKLTGEKGGTVFVAGYHEASNAYGYGIPFVFQLFREQIEFIGKWGERAFRGHFFKRLINKWRNKKF